MSGVVAVLMLAAAACAGGEADDSVRGRGLRVATMPPGAQAAVYDAAVRAGFEVGPGLAFLLDPRRLPRTAGLEGGTPVPAEVTAAMRRRGVVQGTCEPPPPSRTENPRCEARAPGYVVRFSEIFQVAGDTMQVHVAAQRYDTPGARASEVLRFEKVYQLVESGGRWRVVREARAP